MKIATSLACTLASALIASLLAFPVDRAHAQAVETLLGSWSGAGRIDLQGGKTEKIKCNAYNTGAGSELRLVIRCASTSYKVEVRSRLQRQGTSLTGQWEERTYNASGNATGSVNNGNLSLSISGGGFQGTMRVTFSATRMTSTITTTGIDMRSLAMNLSKSGD